MNPKTHAPLDPFHVRVAVCFTDRNGKHPQPKSDFKKMFSVVRGYKAYGSPTSNESTLKDYWRPIESCKNLDAQNPGNINGCPASSVAVKGECPDGQKPNGGVCPTKVIPAAANESDWESHDETWYYDAKSGWLYLHVIQSVDNANGPSPTGSCDGPNPPPECPNASKVPENYYFCPAAGCIAYGVKLVDSEFSAYAPGKSECGVLNGPDRSDHSQLAQLNPPGAVLERDPQVGDHNPQTAAAAFPHYALKGGEGAMCPNPGSAQQPPWGPIPPDAQNGQSFQANYDPKFDVKVVDGGHTGMAPAQYQAGPGNLILASLENGKVYVITVTNRASNNSCVATFKPTGTRLQPAFSKTGGDNCIPPSGKAMIGTTGLN